MIVRISGEGQYRLADGEAEQLNELEREVIGVVDSRREEGFTAAYAALTAFVRDHGELVDDEELANSDVILPPADLSYAEAQVEFTGEGLIPD